MPLDAPRRADALSLPNLVNPTHSPIETADQDLQHMEAELTRKEAELEKLMKEINTLSGALTVTIHVQVFSVPAHDPQQLVQSKTIE